MSIRPSKPASEPAGAIALRANLAQCTAAAHRWNLQEHTCKARNSAPAPATTDAAYDDFDDAYEMAKAPKWTWQNLVTEEDIRGRSDRDRTSQIVKEPDARECPICLGELDERTSVQGSFAGVQLEILQELTEERRKVEPDAPTVCGHAFHANCLEKWIGTGKTTCPACRETIPVEVVARLVPGGVLFIPDDEDDEEEEWDAPVGESTMIGKEAARARVQAIFDNWLPGGGEPPRFMEQFMIQMIKDTIDDVVRGYEGDEGIEPYFYRDHGGRLVEIAGGMELYDVQEWLVNRSLFWATYRW